MIKKNNNYGQLWFSESIFQLKYTTFIVKNTNIIKFIIMISYGM